MSSIVDFVKSQVTSSAVEKLHSFLGIPEEKVVAGLDVIVPAIVSALTKMAQAEDLSVMDLVKPFLGDRFDFKTLAEKGGGLTEILQAGDGVAKTLFGTQLPELVKQIGKSTSLDDHVAGKLLRLAAPGTVSGVVENLGAGADLVALNAAITSQYDSVKGMILPGLLGGALVLGAGVYEATNAEETKAPKKTPRRITVGDTAQVAESHGVDLESLTSSAERIETTHVNPTPVATEPVVPVPVVQTLVETTPNEASVVSSVEPSSRPTASSSSTLSSAPISVQEGRGVLVGAAALSLILFVVAGYFAIVRGNTPSPSELEAMEASRSRGAAALPAVTATLPEPSATTLVDLEVSDSLKLMARPGGVEFKLVEFIKSSQPVDKNTWFSFDRLYFDTGKSTLKTESRDQLENIAKILGAFPKVKLKIGGYTDNTGNAEANQNLSTERAKETMSQLVKLGVDSTKLEAEGYGSQFPVADNATEEGRAKNRRIDLRVTEK